MAAILSGSTPSCALRTSRAAVEPGRGHVEVVHDLPGEGPGLVRVRRRLAVAVHVHGQGGVAHLGQHAGPSACVVVVPPPLVHHQHPRSRPLRVRIEGQVTLHLGFARPVGHFLGLDAGRRARRRGQGQPQHKCRSMNHRILPRPGFLPGRYPRIVQHQSQDCNSTPSFLRAWRPARASSAMTFTAANHGLPLPCTRRAGVSCSLAWFSCLTRWTAGPCHTRSFWHTVPSADEADNRPRRS